MPDELQDRCYGRTEQQGVHLLLKAVATDVQQVLVTDRQMTSTAILFRLYVRYQPGGPGEKSLNLKELTQLQKSTTMAELSSSLRSWRRHFGRAREVGATLPDGTLLLRALEPAARHVAKENSQAAFRLAQSRAALQVDEQPQPSSIWDFRQCLLAEVETLVLMNSTVASTMESPPLKLKVFEVTETDTNASTKPQQDGGASGKGRGGTTADVPCRWFKSDTGCRAGKQCKWLHSWEGINDKNSRCWNCEAKDHRKQECKVKGGGFKPKDETKVSGGGNAASTNKAAGGITTSTSTTSTPKINEMTAASATSTTLSPGELKTGNPGVENVESLKGSGDGGTGGEQAAKNEKTAELLHAATQLLKTLRVQPQSPMLKVMQIGGLDSTEANMVLIDSGATHGPRPARDHDEWQKGERTTVQLANGSTDAFNFRLKPGTKILLGNPQTTASWILPMGGLAELDFTMKWTGNQCQLQDDVGRMIDVQVVHGCPMISLADGQRLLEWLEGYQVHQQRKLAMVRTLLMDEQQVDRSKRTCVLGPCFPGHLPSEFPSATTWESIPMGSWQRSTTSCRIHPSKEEKGLSQWRPIISFVDAPFRPMLNILARLIFQLIPVACPDHFASGDVYTLLTILKSAPVDADLILANQDLAGFFTSIDQERFVNAWFVLLDFLRPHMDVSDNEAFSVYPGKANIPGDIIKGRTFRGLNVTRKIIVKDVPDLIRFALDMQTFALGQKCIHQCRGSPWAAHCLQHSA